MKEIELSQGYVALIDDEDFERVSKFNWFVKIGETCKYAMRNTTTGHRTLHRFIVDAPKGMMVDHKDRNGLNNQKSNLRFTDRFGNSRNQGKQKNNKSGYKGVCFSRAANKWCATIRVENKQLWLGVFKDKEVAAKAYDSAARKYHGEFGYQNFSRVR